MTIHGLPSRHRFLIDLWRESKKPGKAVAFAKAHAEAQVGIPWVVAAEFLAGAIAADQDVEVIRECLGHYPILQSNRVIIRVYAEQYAELRLRNALIGPNDLWIAATALAAELPLITRNVRDFGKINGLQLTEYTGM